jgi:tetratricopeptide (TPR) repeat protein
VTADERARGEALLTGAVAAYESGNFDRCLSMSVEAEELFTRLDDLRRALAARQRQAMVWATNGNLGTAIEINQQLVAHYLELGDHISAAKVGTNLGYNFRLRGRHHEGLAAYTAAWRVFVRHPDRVFECAMTHMNLGAVHRSLGNFARAYAHARRGARLFAMLDGTEMRIIDCLLNAAIAVDQLDRLTEAEALRQQAEALARSINSGQKLARLRHSRATALARRSSYADALLEERAALLGILMAPTLTIGYVQEVLRNVARLHVRTGSPDQAWPFALLASRLAARTLDGLHLPRTRGEWRTRHAEVFDLLCDLLVRRQAWPELAIAIETTRAQQPIADDVPPHALLPGTEGQRRMALDPLPRFTVGDARLDLETAVDAMVTNLTDDPQKQQNCRTAIRRVAGLGEADHDQHVDLRVLADGPKGVVWGTILLCTTLYWYVIDGGRTVGGAIEAGPGTAFGDALGDITQALPDAENYADRVRSGQTVMTGNPGTRLASSLVPSPIRRMWTEAATADQPRSMKFVPAADIARLPIAALPMDVNGTPLLRWLRPVYVPSPALAARTAPVMPGPCPAGLVVADTTGDLPGARRLVEPATPSLSGADATRENLMTALADLRLRSDGPVTFVYAGHTTSVRDVDRAVLRLADAELSAADWLTARGREDFPMPVAVVLLSCSSGGFGSTDWYGLATAAIAAGARIVVSTLWPHTDSVSALDRQVIEAVTTGGDIHTVLDSASLGRHSPFVWSNYAVISGTCGESW